MADNQQDSDAAVREKIAALPAFQDIAARIHEIVMASAPQGRRPDAWT